MLHCNSRMTYGRTEFNRRSRFVDEIPESYCEYEQSFGDRMEDAQREFVNQYSYNTSYGARNGVRTSRVNAEDAPWNKGTSFSKPVSKPTAFSNPKPQSETFSAGQSVTHPIFGDGMVLSAKPMGNDVMYEVAFDKVGTKKIMGNFAKMSKKS